MLYISKDNKIIKCIVVKVFLMINFFSKYLKIVFFYIFYIISIVFSLEGNIFLNLEDMKMFNFCFNCVDNSIEVFF